MFSSHQTRLEKAVCELKNWDDGNRKPIFNARMEQIIVPGGIGLGLAELEIIECCAAASQSQYQQDHQTAHVGFRLFLRRFT